MKKILCLIDTLGPGGAERQMVGLAKLLRQKGYHVDLVTYYKHNFYSELIDQYGIRQLTLRVSKSPLSKLMAVRRYIKGSGGYDWVIAYKVGPCMIGSLLRLMGMKFKLIVSERNTTQVIGRKEKVQFWLYRYADYVVPNSHSQAIFVKEHFPWLKDKTFTITNFTDTDSFTANYTVAGSTRKILTTARVARQKNILRYLEAIALLRDRGADNLHFDWYGDIREGQEEYGEQVFKKVEELKLQDMITFHPATTHIVEYYQTCDVFCLPSNYEGFPNVICEAMSCGKPIVCSRVCDNPYIIKEGENALMFDNANVEDMADKIQHICDMPQDELTSWGKRSRELAESMFSTESFVNKYIKLIENI